MEKTIILYVFSLLILIKDILVKIWKDIIISTKIYIFIISIY